MKILHTADIHITVPDDQRWQALEVILAAARRHQADVLVISGDLFNASYQGDRVRDKIRPLFQSFPGQILLLPGNHDFQAFEDGYFWGQNVQVILDSRRPIRIDNIYFWGLPYQDISPEELAYQLTELNQRAQQLSADAVHLLLFHGELLDVRPDPDAFGDENQRLYMPVQQDHFRGKIWQYVLAGHYHTRFKAYEMEPGKYFVYPGSPVSITRKEVGIRKVNLFSPGHPPREVPVATFHYELLHLTITPQDRWPSFRKRLQQRLQSLPPTAKPLITVGGHFDSQKLGLTEDGIHQALRELLREEAAEFSLQAIDIHRIVSDDLFETLQETIKNGREFTPEDQRELIEFLISIMAEEAG